MWNPKQAGEVFVTLADHLMKGNEPKDGETLEGLGVIHPDFTNRNIIVDQLVPINKDTVDKLADMGLWDNGDQGRAGVFPVRPSRKFRKINDERAVWQNWQTHRRIGNRFCRYAISM